MEQLLSSRLTCKSLNPTLLHYAVGPTGEASLGFPELRETLIIGIGTSYNQYRSTYIELGAWSKQYS